MQGYKDSKRERQSENPSAHYAGSSVQSRQPRQFVTARNSADDWYAIISFKTDEAIELPQSEQINSNSKQSDTQISNIMLVTADRSKQTTEAR